MRRNQHAGPPKWPLKLLRLIIRDSYLEEIEGDMEEVFQDDLELFSRWRARWRYAWGTLRLFKPAIIKRFSGDYRLNNYGMFKNHLTIALRTFWRERAFTLINLLGLTLGICCTLLITLWIQDEYAVDRFHEKGDRILQVMRNEHNQEGEITTLGWSAYPVGDALVEEYPEIIKRARYTGQDIDLKIRDKVVAVTLSAADPEIFEIFSFPLVAGDPSSSLSETNSVVISERLANTHFPDEEAVGQTVTLMQGTYELSFVVGGVMKDIPSNSTVRFDAVIPIEFLLQFNSTYESWGNSWMQTYVLAEEGSALENINEKVEFLAKEKADIEWFTIFLSPFQDQYLYSKYENGKSVGGRVDYILLMGVIAAFTLLIACFNFVNLTTARSSKRTKEIGIRKVMGANRSTLLAQFTMESTLLTLASVVVALFLAQALMPSFGMLASKNLAIDFSDTSLYLTLGAITLSTVLLSGVYPAIFLSSFHAINALKGEIKKKSGSITLGKALVVIQFGLSMMLIAGTLIVFQQLTFIQNKDLGIDKENVVIVPYNSQTYKHRQAIMTELGRQPALAEVSSSSGNFMWGLGSTSDPTWEGKPADAGQLWFTIMTIDYGLIEMMDIDVLQGRSFSTDFSTDTLNYLINEAAARQMALDDPVGASLKFWGEEGTIVGVVKNFHFNSLHSPIYPMILRCRPKGTDLIYVKTQPGQTEEALRQMEKVHEEFSTLAMSYHFLDDVIEEGYQQEQRTQAIAGAFAGLSIFISCLGLLGLASFSAQQRVREIAIRKVLGARLQALMGLLFKQYFALILIGLLVGVPIVHYWSSTWLSEFTYRIEVSWWIYLVPISLILVIAFLTISRISIQTANSNPVDSLRNE